MSNETQEVSEFCGPLRPDVKLTPLFHDEQETRVMAARRHWEELDVRPHGRRFRVTRAAAAFPPFGLSRESGSQRRHSEVTQIAGDCWTKERDRLRTALLERHINARLWRVDSDRL